MGKTGSSPEAMEKMVQTLTKFIEVQDSVVESLKSSYAEVGEEWDDKKYEELGDVIDDASASIKGSYATLSMCITKVQVLKGILEEYLAQRLN